MLSKIPKQLAHSLNWPSALSFFLVAAKVRPRRPKPTSSSSSSFAHRSLPRCPPKKKTTTSTSIHHDTLPRLACRPDISVDHCTAAALDSSWLPGTAFLLAKSSSQVPFLACPSPKGNIAPSSFTDIAIGSSSPPLLRMPQGGSISPVQPL